MFLQVDDPSFLPFLWPSAASVDAFQVLLLLLPLGTDLATAIEIRIKVVQSEGGGKKRRRGEGRRYF